MISARLFSVATAALVAGIVAWGFLFHVSDADVWWHVKSGQIMLETGRLIDVDPFAHTREGLPYLATHKWMAQVLLALAYRLGGPSALIVLRILLTLLTGGVLLSIDRRGIWPNVLLVGAALLIFRQNFVERPQLFSNVLFALSLVLCLRLLDLPPDDVRRRRQMLAGLLALTVLWANLHGGAAILAPVLLGTVLAQELLHRRSVLELIGWCVLLTLALLATPNLYHNVTYLHLLLTDETSVLLAEWTASPIEQYLLWIGPFWILAIAAMSLGRRSLVAASLLLLGMGALSRMGSRHEVLFVLTALGIALYELRWSVHWRDLRERLLACPLPASVATVILVALLVWLNEPYRQFFLRRNLQGFGAFSTVAGAADFLDRGGNGSGAIEGRLFNTYTAGGYLLFRGHKVFIDGRNVDYGYDFLRRALDARYDRAIFDALTREEGITVAVIERFTADAQEDRTFAFLETHPEWALCFLDDWAAVYIKRASEQAATIERCEYRVLQPEFLDAGRVLDRWTEADVVQLESELRRAHGSDPRGIRTLLLLSKIERSRGRFAEAISHAELARERWPYRYEPEEILASIAAFQERWIEAATHYDRALWLSRHLEIALPYAQLAMVYERAGRPGKAATFRRKAGMH